MKISFLDLFYFDINMQNSQYFQYITKIVLEEFKLVVMKVSIFDHR